ncbi:MAG: hypothetical protein HYV75_08590, partial [Opitutae bacterium]|nr:hypothetical protein [Opitutae bacterium]
MNAQLSNHPLNRAALVLLRRAQVTPGEARSAKAMPVLLLPMSLLDEKDDRQAVLSDYARNDQMQALALKRLSQVLTPDELLNGTPEQAAEQV